MIILAFVFVFWLGLLTGFVLQAGFDVLTVKIHFIRNWKVRQEVKKHGLIAGIKLYRAFTGQGLKESKDAVEKLCPGVKPAWAR